MNRTDRGKVLLLGSGTLGFGFGALLDVVVFHLTLQWHHLLSGRIPTTTLGGLQANVYYDGLFSLAMLGVALVGAGLMWRVLNRSSEPYSAMRTFGSLLVGAGLFNVFDGTVDHYVLGLHDVVHGTQAFNPHWVGASLLLLGVGILISTR
ncbi:DUF2243 domain-containing protein [Halorussus salinisoli]|uniref:DUF2243 domain-containing protein n=1 Tax=Halorussus salinisoli TaxID=2558242 RepID=UPI0010C15BF7|nr:DUF2243 domain-containing protein [Halorussus salinisoli]